MVDLTDAHLSCANLLGAVGLGDRWLAAACWNSATTLPDGSAPSDVRTCEKRHSCP